MARQQEGRQVPFESDLVLRSQTGKENYTLDDPLIYRRRNGEVITVPAGFTTDLASVPRIFWSMLPRDGGKHRVAAVVHDYLVEHKSWGYAADVLSEALTDNGTAAAPRLLIVYAVRLWGAVMKFWRGR